MATQQAVINDLKKFADDILASGIHLRRLVLFGSYSRNEQKEWSDIDVALAADEFNSFGFEDVSLISKVMLKYANLDISPRTYKTIDFNTEKDPFVGEILKTGIEII